MKRLLPALLLALLIASGASPAPARAQATDDSSASFDRIGSCLSGGGRLLLLAVVDESASLRRTDPDGIRVDALETVVRNVAQLGQKLSSTSGVEIGFASFATDFTMLGDWTQATAATSAELSSIARAFAARNGGIDTDFAAAFVGARDALDERAAAVAANTGQSVCKVLLTFTDGEYDLEPRGRETFYAPGLPLDQPGNPEEAKRRGRALLCEDGGIADDLHGADTVVLTVGLGSGIAADDQRFLEALSTGRGCGDVEGTGLGAWISADDLQGLVFAFDEASSGIAGGAVVSDEEITPCPVEACPSGSTTFTLDESLSQFHLLVAAPDPLLVELRAPDGSTVELSSGLRQSLAGAELEVIDLQAASIVDGVLPLPATWAGEWTVTFIDPTGESSGLLGRAHVVLFGGLAPSIEVVGNARVGEEFSVAVRAVGEDGAPRVPDGFIAQVETRLEASDPTGDSPIEVADQGPGPEGWTFRVSVPEGLQSSSLELRSVLEITTAGGIRLPTTESSVAVSVAPPATYPRIEPAVVDFGATTGTDAAAAQLRIVGGEDPGCVVFGEPRVDAGPLAGSARLTVEGVASGSCLEVAPGESRSVEVVLDHDENVSADVNGALPVTLRSDVSGDEVMQEVAVTGQLVRVVDTAKRNELFILFLSLGLLLPLLVLYLLNRRAARFRRPSEERMASLGARVTTAGVLERRSDNGFVPFSLSSTDFAPLGAPSGNPRSFSARGLDFDSRVPAWPLKAPFATAHASGQSATAALGDVASDGGSTAARLPFGLSGQWLFLAQDQEEGGGRTGTLDVFLNGAIAFDHVADRLVQTLKLEVPPAVLALPQGSFGSGPEDDAAPGDNDGAKAQPDMVSESDAWSSRHYSPGTSAGTPWGTDEGPPKRRRLLKRKPRNAEGSDEGVDETPAWTPPETGGWSPPDFSNPDDRSS